MSVLLDNAINKASQAIQRVKLDLAVADTLALHTTVAKREESALRKSWVYVWPESVQEECVRTLVQSLLTEIAAQSVPKNRLRKTLYALVFANRVQSLKDAKHLRGLNDAATMFMEVDDAAACVINLNHTVLDGKTIRSQHYECIWNVFGFPLPFLPSPRHPLALKDLADGRNDVAHGHEDPIRFGRAKSAMDIMALADRLEECLMHFYYAADKYLTHTGYRVP